MNEFKNLEESYQKYDLKFLTISLIISTFLIAIIFNLKIDFYLRGFIIPCLIVLTTYLINLYHNKLINNHNSLYLLIPIGLILINSLIFNVNSSNKVLNIFIILCLITYFIFSLINKKFQLTSELFPLIFSIFLDKLFTNLNNINKLFKEKTHSKQILHIILGLIIGIPICIVILLLLSSADYYFGYFIENIINNILNILNIEFIWKNLFVISISFILTFSIFINYMLKRKDEENKTKLINVSSSTLGTILILINLVFMLFLITEISKVTTNFLNIPIEYTYAEYAREGFFQLLFITSINFIITIFTIYKTKLKDNKLINILLLVLIGFSILLIFNSYYRMFLYISAYTFTILRLQVILFLTLELVLFILLIKKITNEIKYDNFKLFTLISLIFYIINLYLCNDIVINFINKIIA
ncbi:MAG: DUF4173 domain-containing protein [Bacilli bacterium]|nr:DUF4173 domain-containing protein [Bacilli bacterium]